MTPKSLQSRLKIAKNAKFGSTEAGAKAEAEEGVVVSSLGERDETETDEGDGRADLARGTCSACLFVDHTCVREENNTQTDPLDHFGAQGEKAEEEDAELVLTEDERRGVALLTDEAVGMARQLVRTLRIVSAGGHLVG
ncbi:hypothetical protein KFU94_01545 [Chloroflexi bacterium TSY]|nr:hypothetical protein [Chloroflexi bacterium TSY]